MVFGKKGSGVSIHEAYTGLDKIQVRSSVTPAVSIHEAYTGLDANAVAAPFFLFTFQSTRPIQASTRISESIDSILAVSIHEAYTGLDTTKTILTRRRKCFNPRGLYRPRRRSNCRQGLKRKFQSTRPIQASTWKA